jgi:hypothetical protein
MAAAGRIALTRAIDGGANTAATNLGLTFRGCYDLVLSSYHDGDIARFVTNAAVSPLPL